MKRNRLKLLVMGNGLHCSRPQCSEVQLCRDLSRQEWAPKTDPIVPRKVPPKSRGTGRYLQVKEVAASHGLLTSPNKETRNVDVNGLCCCLDWFDSWHVRSLSPVRIWVRRYHVPALATLVLVRYGMRCPPWSYHVGTMLNHWQ